MQQNLSALCLTSALITSVALRYLISFVDSHRQSGQIPGDARIGRYLLDTISAVPKVLLFFLTLYVRSRLHNSRRCSITSSRFIEAFFDLTKGFAYGCVSLQPSANTSCFAGAVDESRMMCFVFLTFSLAVLCFEAPRVMYRFELL
jgi:hypothetical protein